VIAPAPALLVKLPKVASVTEPPVAEAPLAIDRLPLAAP